MSETKDRVRRELIVRRVQEVDCDLSRDDIDGAINAVATNPSALWVLARALEGSHDPLVSGAPPLVGRLVTELRARGSVLEEPRCTVCGRAHLKLTASGAGALCPRCRHRELATACSACGVVKPVGGRGSQGEALCARCAPRPRRVCSVCGRTRPIARRAHEGVGEICDSCYKGPVALCATCGRMRPCNFVAMGRPICISCAPRRTSRCAHCARTRPACVRWPEGPVCEPCYRAALSRRGFCERCGRDRRLVAPPGPGARLCADCGGVPPLACCRSCGAEERLYADGECVRCALRTRVRQLVGDPDGPLRPVYEAIVTAPQPYSTHNWLRSSAGAAVLGELAAGTLSCTHEALDAHPHRRGADHLRHLLVATGVLAPRDDEIARLEDWIAARLKSVEDPARRRLLRSYATWRLLRRARARTSGADLTRRTPTQHAKTCLNAAVAFLAHLSDRGQDLATVTQADVDAWLASGPPNARLVADFLDWAASRHHTERLNVPGPVRAAAPAIADDKRWQIARRLLCDETIDLGDRVAGSLVLLYGQQLSRIVTLTHDQVSFGKETTRLELGSVAIDIPPPLDGLFARLAAERRPYSGIAPSQQRWLFPGLDPGRPLTAYQLGQRLQRLDIQPSSARRAALAHLGGRLPAALLSRLLGIAPTTAVRWTRVAGGDWNTYAAQIARRA